MQIFISYAREDQAFASRLRVELDAAQRHDKSIRCWSDVEIHAGGLWDDLIRNNICNSNIVILLISSDFMASSYIWDKELPHAIDREASSLCIIVPVIIRPTASFFKSNISKYQALPRNGTPMSEWVNYDQAWENVIKDLLKFSHQVGGVNEENSNKEQIPRWRRFARYFLPIRINIKILISIAASCLLAFFSYREYPKPTQIAVNSDSAGNNFSGPVVVTNEGKVSNNEAKPPKRIIKEYVVFFEFNKNVITPAADVIIRNLVNQFDYTKSSIHVIGHTDTSDSPAYAQKRSLKQAESVKAALVNYGVPAASITVEGRGETQLLVPTGPNVREPSNRRAQILILSEQ
jgi:outer membrane protein OmpA-like peptidoglycan-associated protein